ncbi:MAG: C2H2-type zinc finger protein [Ignavibacteriota bacterium]
MENPNTTQSQPATEEFRCDVCGEQFDTLSSLDSHKTRHNRPSSGLADTQREIRGDIGAAGMPTSPLP